MFKVATLKAYVERKRPAEKKMLNCNSTIETLGSCSSPGLPAPNILAVY